MYFLIKFKLQFFPESIAVVIIGKLLLVFIQYLWLIYFLFNKIILNRILLTLLETVLLLYFNLLHCKKCTA